MQERLLDKLRRWLGEEPRAQEMVTVALSPIGVVRNGVKEPQMGGWEKVESRIVVQEKWAGALDGLDGFSHVFVLFWLHRVEEEARQMTHIHPRGDPDIPLQGVFATRTQLRPNPIGLSVVPIVGRKGNALRVRGLDAINGTPVLDLKPYVGHYDSVPQATIPDWAERLAERHWHFRPGETQQ